MMAVVMIDEEEEMKPGIQDDDDVWVYFRIALARRVIFSGNILSPKSLVLLEN